MSGQGPSLAEVLAALEAYYERQFRRGWNADGTRCISVHLELCADGSGAVCLEWMAEGQTHMEAILKTVLLGEEARRTEVVFHLLT